MIYPTIFPELHEPEGNTEKEEKGAMSEEVKKKKTKEKGKKKPAK